MKMRYLVHDAGWEGSEELLHSVLPFVRDCDVVALRTELLRTLIGIIERFQEAAVRQQHRLSPTTTQ